MSSNYYDQPTGSWNTKTYIYDSGLNSFEEAKAALYGLWLFLLVGIAICAAFVTKSRSALALSIFKPHKFWLAIALAIVYHAFTFAYDLAKHYQNEVTYAYLLVTEIFIDFYYPASICLLATIFGLLFQIFQRPQTGPQRHRRILWLHYAFCGLLFVIYITIFGLEVRGLYTEVFDGESIIYFVRDIPVQDVVNVVFDALYAGASFEIFVASIIIFSTRTNNQAKSNVPLLLLTLVAFPLLVSSCFTLGYDATYEVGRGPFRNILGTTIANDVISGLAWVLPFAGLIAISIQPEVSEADSDLEHGAMQQGQFAPSHAPPAYPEGIIPDKEHPRAQGNRFSEWKDRMADWRPSFRKGGKSSLGLRTAF